MLSTQLRKDESGNLLVPGTCSCCRKCWKYITGPAKGKCIYGGPFEGFEKEKHHEGAEDCSVPKVSDKGDGQQPG